MAIAAAEAYLVAEAMFLPDGRVSGLSDAMALIRARYIGVPSTAEDRRLSLYSLSSREFEVLVHRLYDAMGYDAELTPPRSDGGRDVIAIRQDPTRRASLRVECKLYQDPVGVEVARALLGVVFAEHATGGVIVGADGFTRGARALERTNPQLELIDGAQLIVLLNEHLGTDWPLRLDMILSPHSGPV